MTGTGQDDEGLDSRDYRALRKAIRSSGKNVVVHALAFTSFHDFEFLNTIRRDLGTVEGGFQVPAALLTFTPQTKTLNFAFVQRFSFFFVL